MKLVKILNHLNEGQSEYYRAVTKYIGKNVIFEPRGYYEAINSRGEPIMMNGTDIFIKSNIPEIAASKIIGGAVLGLWSMGRQHKKKLKTAYIYSIKDKPNKDLSHLRIADFEWLKEVRYTHNVGGIYVGKFSYTNAFNNNAEMFYERLNASPYDEFDENYFENWDDFERLILTMNRTNLS